jgi:hypothetical protein
MCPACIASAALMAAGAGSTCGILAVCIGKFRNFFKASGARNIVQRKYKEKEKRKWQPAKRNLWQ